MSQVAQVLCNFYSEKPGVWDDAVNVEMDFFFFKSNLFYTAIKTKMKSFVVIILQSFWVYPTFLLKIKINLDSFAEDGEDFCSI